LDKHALVNFSKTSNSIRPSDSYYFEVFEKLTRACYVQIALEIAGVENIADHGTIGPRKFFMLAERKKGRKKKGERRKRKERKKKERKRIERKNNCTNK
jgi:hypothetical protein